MSARLLPFFALRLTAALCGFSVFLFAGLCAETAPADDPKAWRQPAEELRKQGKFKDALPLAEEALARTEQTLGPAHLETARGLELVGVLRRETAAYAAGQAALERAAEIARAAAGAEAADTLRIRNELAGLHYRAGRYAEAETLWRELLAARERVHGRDSHEAGVAAGRLALARHAVADYAQAETLLRRALAAEEKKSGPDSHETAMQLANLANIYTDLGDYARAEPLHRRALAISEKEPGGAEASSTGTDLHNLARTLMQLGRFDEAEPLYNRALAIWERAHGPDHPRVARALGNLAALKTMRGDVAEAVPMLERVLRLREKTLGPEDDNVAYTLTQLTALRLRLANAENEKTVLAEAEIALRRAVAIHDRKGTGAKHDAASALEALAVTLARQGKREEALACSRRAAGVREGLIAQVLSLTTSEARRLEYLARRDHLALAVWLGDAAGIAEIVLRTKGAVLDSLLEDQRVSDGGGATAETALTARRALGVKSEAVQAALKSRSALVEFVRCHQDPLCSLLADKPAQAFVYGAVILAPGRAPTWVPLGESAALEPTLETLSNALRNQRGDRLELETALRKVSRALWQPIAAALPRETEEVIVSPEGALNFVSFAALLAPDGDGFVAETLRVRYVASGRDLLPAHRAATTPAGNAAAVANTLVVFSNPALSLPVGELKPVVQLAANTAELRRSVEPAELLRSLDLRPLPAAEAEGRAVLAYAQKHGWSGQLRTGEEATERELFALHAPRVLHLATHGFFLPPSAAWQNPMQRSGLALAGAATTLAAWERGETPPPENDGIVAAAEVARLNLRDTWLAVLSACDSGLGEARAGEGVFGLRRGFALAGVQHVLLTLWPVGDEETAALMLDFYAAAEKTGDPPHALADAQRARLARLRKERGIAAAARLAGPFIVSSQAR